MEIPVYSTIILLLFCRCTCTGDCSKKSCSCKKYNRGALLLALIVEEFLAAIHRKQTLTPPLQRMTYYLDF